MGHRGAYGIIHVQCDRLGVRRCKPVAISVCVLVAVYSDMGCLVYVGIQLGTGGEWVRYLHSNILNKA